MALQFTSNNLQIFQSPQLRNALFAAVFLSIDRDRDFQPAHPNNGAKVSDKVVDLADRRFEGGAGVGLSFAL